MAGECGNPRQWMEQIRGHTFKKDDQARRGDAFCEKRRTFYSLSEKVKKKLAECKTQEEIRRVLAEAGVDPPDNELPDAVAGGSRPFFPRPN